MSRLPVNSRCRARVFPNRPLPLIGSDFVTSLSPAGVSPESIATSIANPGTFWVGACVNAVIGEVNMLEQDVERYGMAPIFVRGETDEVR